MRSILFKIIIYGLAGIIALWSLFAIYWMAISAFRPPKVLLEASSLVPGPFSLVNFYSLLEQSSYGRYYINSIIVACSATFITLIIAVLMAYAMTRFKIKRTRLILRFVLFSYMFPHMLLVIPIYEIFVLIGIEDTLSSVVIACCTICTPLSIWLLWGFFKTCPFEIEEAALVDGASRIQAIYKITLPIALPGIISAGIFSFIITWSDYIFALVLLPSNEKRTVTVGLGAMVEAFSMFWGEIMAGSILVCLPLFIIFAFLGRYFLQGLTAGAIKG